MTSNSCKFLIVPSILITLFWFILYFILLTLTAQQHARHNGNCVFDSYKKDYDSYTVSYKVAVPTVIFYGAEQEVRKNKVKIIDELSGAVYFDQEVYVHSLNSISAKVMVHKTLPYGERHDFHSFTIEIRSSSSNVMSSGMDYSIGCFDYHLEIERYRVFILVGVSITIFVLCICVILWILAYLDSTRHR